MAGQFRLGEVLGRGGMGEVYSAAALTSGKPAAVKLLHGKALADGKVVQRFLREAEIAMQLRAASLVEIYELGETEGGVPYLAMELLSGKDLGWLLRRQRQLPIEDVVAMAKALAGGLAVAHQAGVVHRDLKPANLFCLDGGAGWKILDFGVAKIRGSTGTLTQHAIIGTPNYMSPEQAQGRDVDARSDLFSLAAVIYRALTGRPAFSAPDTPQVLFDIVYRNPIKPSSVMPTLPPEVDLVLALALAKNRSDRFSSAEELAEALSSAASGELSPSLRRSATALLRRLPWGTTTRPGP
jgi:serine/threonine-protein kinase